MTIPIRYGLLRRVARNADWLGSDEFHQLVAVAGGGLWETWLNFVAFHGGLGHYAPRLKTAKEQCTIAFREIAAAHFLVAKCGMRLLGWQVPGAHNTLGEFLVARDVYRPIFVEVKSPRWQAEIVRACSDSHPRLKMPKHVRVETRFTTPLATVNDAIAKAYPKMPDDKSSLLVINDDLTVPLAFFADITGDVGLYAPKSRLNPIGGAFADNRYENLGGVGLLTVRSFDSRRGVDYAFALFENPHAVPTVALPLKIAEMYPRYNASGRVG